MLVSNKQRCLCEAMRMMLTIPLNKLVTSTNETCTEHTFSSGCSHLQQSVMELQITNSLQCSAVSVSTVCNTTADHQQFAMFHCICFNNLQQNCRSPTVCRCSAISVSAVCNRTADHQQFANVPPYLFQQPAMQLQIINSLPMVSITETSHRVNS